MNTLEKFQQVYNLLCEVQAQSYDIEIEYQGDYFTIADIVALQDEALVSLQNTFNTLGNKMKVIIARYNGQVQHVLLSNHELETLHRIVSGAPVSPERRKQLAAELAHKNSTSTDTLNFYRSTILRIRFL